MSSDAGDDSMKLQRADNLVKQRGTRRWLMLCVFSHLMLKRGYNNSQSVHEDVCLGFFLVMCVCVYFIVFQEKWRLRKCTSPLFPFLICRTARMRVLEKKKVAKLATWETLELRVGSRVGVFCSLSFESKIWTCSAAPKRDLCGELLALCC